MEAGIGASYIRKWTFPRDFSAAFVYTYGIRTIARRHRGWADRPGDAVHVGGY